MSFLALDTGEPAENLWLFQTSVFEAIKNGDSVWIPVETTVLKDGFPTAWSKASELVRSYPGQIEFLPVAQLRDIYPPLWERYMK